MSVLFINTGYLPTYDEWVRLENIQREIAGWRAQLERDFILRKFSAGERYLSKLKFHQGVRDNWKIYNNPFFCKKSIIDKTNENL